MGRKVLFLERDVPWYAQNRDLPAPDFCEFALYSSLMDLQRRFAQRIADARAVIVGSYVPDGIAVIDLVLKRAAGVTGFYDIDTRSRSRRWTPAMRPILPRAKSPGWICIFRLLADRRWNGSPGASVPGAPARCIVQSTPSTGGRSALQCAGTWVILAPTAPTASRRSNDCCWSRPDACLTSGSSLPARNILRR